MSCIGDIIKGLSCDTGGLPQQFLHACRRSRPTACVHTCLHVCGHAAARSPSRQYNLANDVHALTMHGVFPGPSWRMHVRHAGDSVVHAQQPVRVDGIDFVARQQL